MKQLIIKLVANWLPDILDFLIKKSDKKGKIGNYGKAAKELKDVVVVYEKAAKDGIIDGNEIKGLAIETIELASAISVLFGKEFKIVFKNKK